MSVPTRLTTDNTFLVIIDIQERMFRPMYEKEILLQNALKLIRGAQVLELPIIMTEQYPAGLGKTLPEITEIIPNVRPVEKLTFSCCGVEGFVDAASLLGRKQALVIGIEAHVCVYQTAIDLLTLGYGVHVAVDCISSRAQENKKIAVKKMNSAGIHLISAEMALFEILKSASSDKFKQISNIVK